ncbi:MAG: hypothetical protein U0641_03175 [Anaerolineae bacterium]
MRHRVGWMVLAAAALIVAALFVGASAFGVGSAQAAPDAATETVVILVDYTTANNAHRVMGTVVANRPVTGQTLSDWSFSGSFDGRAVTASGKVLEIWQAPTVVRMVCYQLHTSFDWLLLLVREGLVRQDAQSLLMFTFHYPQWPNEAPRDGAFAIGINGWIHPPGTPNGQLSYMITQPGAVSGGSPSQGVAQGPTPIKRLPGKLPGGVKPAPIPLRERLADIVPWILEH